ncbi:MAG: hypothetical protein C0599_08105 [Salinivirgaceae bacterium]|nr:MAG: hypothetical protein C0599_08105 [Salinivirgaceae bacterium]
MKTKQLIFAVALLLCTQLVFAQTMHLAIKNGELDQVKLLVDNNSELLIEKYTIDTTINYFMPKEISPLFDAVLYGRYEIIEYLIEKGVDLKKDNYAIYLAVIQKNEKIKDLLIKNGARITNDITPHMRPNILTQAVWLYPDIDIIKELIDLGAPINVDWGLNGNYTHTPLGMATRKMLPEIAKLLIENGAIMNLSRNNGQIGLHDAIFYWNRFVPRKEYSPELLIYLLENGGDTKHKDLNGNTPFEYAAIEGVNAALKILWDDEYDVTQTNMDGMTLLHRTVIKGYLKNVEFLISKGFDINAQDNYRNTPLFYANKYGHEKIAELIKNKGGISNKVLEHEAIENILNKELKEGQAYVWYLGRLGWAVKTKNNIIIKPYEWGEVKPDNPSLANGSIVAKELYNQNILMIHDKIYAEEIAAYRDSLETDFSERSINLIYPIVYESDQINSVQMKELEETELGTVKVLKGKNGNWIIVADGVKLLFADNRKPMPNNFPNEQQNIDISFFSIGWNSPVEVVADTETKIEVFKPKMIFFQSLYTCSDLYQKASNGLKANDCKIEIPVAKFPGDCYFFDASKLAHLDNYYAENEKISGIKEIERALEKGEFMDVLNDIERIIKNKEKYYYYTSELNSLGYKYLGEGKNDEAIQCFKWNVFLFPDHYNVYDSLGEAYAKNGNIKLAIQSYKKAYEINPENIQLKQIIESLENKL